MSRKETKIQIPFPSRSARQIDLVGVLSQHDPTASTSTATRRPLALILHGVLSHKDQSFHPLLAAQLPIDSLRFDFRGNAESPLLQGQEWDMAGFHEDCRDVDAVIEYMQDEYGYEVDVIIGHSRGSLIGWKWMSEAWGDEAAPASDAEEQQHIQRRRQRGVGSGRAPPLWVSLCGRWNMDRIHDRDQVYAEQFKERGYFEWKAKVAGKQVTARVTPASVEAFATYPIADYVARYPSHSPPLLVHGTADETVPCADLGYYINALSAKHAQQQHQKDGPSTTWGQVHLVEGANHMLRGKYDEVVAVVKQWYEAQRAGRGSATDGPQMALEAQQEGDVLERSWNESGAGRGKL